MADNTPVKTPITDEVATTEKDIDIFSGWLSRLENPDPILRTESAGKGMRLYDEVARDAHASAVLQSRYLAVAGCEWEVTPADDSAKSVEIADFVNDALDRINLTQAISELMQAILYGYKVSEIMWTQKNGAWIPAKIIGKHSRRFVFDLDRKPRMLTPASMIDGELLPDRKFVVFTYGSTDNPYGEGLGQKLWWPVWFKKHGIKYWMVFLEKFGMPTLWGKYPSGTLPEDQGKLLDAIDAVQNETGITTPDNMALEFLEAARTGNVTYETLCEYMDKQISKAVLGQTATTEGTPGKLGNDDTQDDVRQDIKKADADLVAEVLNATLVRWIVDYNFAGVSEYPAFWLRTDQEQDLKPLAERDQILSNIGLPIGEGYFYDTYGIPKPEKDEALVKAAAPESRAWPAPTGNEADGVGAGHAREFAETRFTPDQQAIEDLVEDALSKARPASEAVSKSIKDAIDKAESYEDLHILLAEIMTDADASKLIDDIMAQSLLAADMWGRYAGR